MLSSICNISKRTVSNQQVQVSSGTVGKPKRTFSFNPIRRETNEIEQSSKIQVYFSFCRFYFYDFSLVKIIYYANSE
jgi:hypothetical protein